MWQRISKKGRGYSFLEFSSSKHNTIILFLLMVYYASSAFPPVSSITEVSFYLLLLMAGIAAVVRKISIGDNQLPLNLVMKLMVVWGLVTALFSGKIENSIHDWYKYLLFPVFIIFVFVASCKEKKQLERVVSVSVVSLGLVLVGAALYFYGSKGSSLTWRMNVIKETGISINSVGVVAAVPFFLGLWFLLKENLLYKKIIFGFCVVGAIVAMLLSATRGALIGFLLPWPLMFLVVGRKKMIVLFCILLVLIGFFPAKDILKIRNIKKRIEIMERPAIWSLYGGVVADRPVMGLGFGMENYDQPLYDKYLSELPEKKRKILENKGFYYTHNMFLDTAVRTGVVGLFLLIVLVLSTFRLLINLYKTCNNRDTRMLIVFLGSTLLSIVAQGMLTDIFLIRHAYIFYMLLAFIISLYSLEKQEVSA